MSPNLTVGDEIIGKGFVDKTFLETFLEDLSLLRFVEYVERVGMD